ncbi:hypothetical protein LWI29_002299 [Acer saccharum]|uniref:Uncharacterized protein n=1 Tax=Acer saccharum TaxID=4024 RepID=A0AA39SS32_ACESA|nr:hypothetical protein LWI29_002299 [Acer saccharum]
MQFSFPPSDANQSMPSEDGLSHVGLMHLRMLWLADLSLQGPVVATNFLKLISSCGLLSTAEYYSFTAAAVDDEFLYVHPDQQDEAAAAVVAVAAVAVAVASPHPQLVDRMAASR